MNNIEFKIPDKKTAVKISLSASDEIYKKLVVISYANGITMGQTVEMLVLASIDEYFDQNREIADRFDELAMEAVGEKRKYCSNSACPHRFVTHRIGNMFRYKDYYFCSEDCREYFVQMNAGRKPSIARSRCNKCSIILEKGTGQDKIGGHWYCRDCADKVIEDIVFDRDVIRDSVDRISSGKGASETAALSV